MKNPYEHLYIYNFDRIPVLDTHIETHDNFLGTWEEDGTAFLFFSASADALVDGLAERNPDTVLVERYEMCS